MTVVYIDSLFLLNFVVNYLLLLAAARLSARSSAVRLWPPEQLWAGDMPLRSFCPVWGSCFTRCASLELRCSCCCVPLEAAGGCCGRG